MQVIYDRQQPGLLTQALVNWGLGTWMDNYNNRGQAKDLEFAGDYATAQSSYEKASILDAIQKNRAAWNTAIIPEEKKRYAQANIDLRNKLYQMDAATFNQGVLNADTSDQGLTDMYSKQLAGVDAIKNKYKNNKRYSPSILSRFGG